MNAATVSGWDFVPASLSEDGDGIDRDPSSTDPFKFQHGLKVQGVISAQPNQSGSVGIAPGAKVRHIRVGSGTNGMISYSAFLSALKYINENPSDNQVVSMSFAFQDRSCPSEVQQLISSATNKGVVFISSAGNQGRAASNYPANCDDVIGVGAVNPTWNRASFSTFGDSAELYAPGESMFTTVYDGSALGTYASARGTSYAAPYVAGAAALYREAFPQASARDVSSAIQSSSRERNGLKQVDVGRLVSQVPAQTTPPVSTPTPPVSTPITPVTPSAPGVSGAIAERYHAGGGASTFGTPVTGEYKVGNGVAQNFSRGYTIFWSASTGAHPVYVKGALGTAYLKNQGQWGFPVGSATAVNGGSYQDFRSGTYTRRAYWSFLYGVQVLNANGAIHQMYLARGGSRIFGVPVTSEQYRSSDGAYFVRFSNGQTVSWTASRGAWVN